MIGARPYRVKEALPRPPAAMFFCHGFRRILDAAPQKKCLPSALIYRLIPYSCKALF